MPDIPPRPAHPEYASQVAASFARQNVMSTIGARLLSVEPGRVEIGLAYRADLGQQAGYLHAGITTTIADSAGGYACLSLFAADEEVLTTEIKLNLLAPAAGDHFVATGNVVKSGRTLSVCQVEVHTYKAGRPVLCAYGLMTTIRLKPGQA